MSAFLEIRGLTLTYGNVSVLKNFALDLEQGVALGLTGKSGQGKTSVLRCIAGLEKPSAGVIRLNGREISALPTHLRRVGFVFQNNALFPHMSVAKNIAFGIEKDPNKEEKIAQMLGMLGLEGLGQRKPHELSGGQQQRVAIGRTLVTEPELLMMDEPFSDLDIDTRTALRDEIGQLIEAQGLSTILVSHHEEDVKGLCSRVLHMD